MSLSATLTSRSRTEPDWVNAIGRVPALPCPPNNDDGSSASPTSDHKKVEEENGLNVMIDRRTISQLPPPDSPLSEIETIHNDGPRVTLQQKSVHFPGAQ